MALVASKPWLSYLFISAREVYFFLFDIIFKCKFKVITISWLFFVNILLFAWFIGALGWWNLWLVTLLVLSFLNLLFLIIFAFLRPLSYWLFVHSWYIGLVAGCIDNLASMDIIDSLWATSSRLIFNVVFNELFLAGVLFLLAPIRLRVLILSRGLPSSLLPFFAILAFVKEKVKYHIQ